MAHAGTGNDKVISFVMPQFVNSASPFLCNDVFNGVQTETSFADKQFFMGKGAALFQLHRLY